MYSFKNKIIQYFYKTKRILANFYLAVKKKIFVLLKIEEKKFSQTDLDKKLVYSLSKSRIPSLGQLKYIKKFLSPTELKLIKVCSLVIFLSLSVLFFNFYRNNLQTVPVLGGDYTEGLVGAVKYVNPLYAGANDADNDISHLIFSSLFKYDKDGNLVNDLVTDYQISEDGKTYTLTVRTDALWHNGKKLTVDDIVFTFNAIQDSRYKSYLYSNFLGVNIEKVDEKTINFILLEPYAAFPNLLTFGILPQELWSQTPPETAGLAELNTKPIGSGPYKFKSLIKDKAGNIKVYNLIANEDYYDKTVYVEEISFEFFVNFIEAVQALNANEIDGISYLPDYVKGDLTAKSILNLHNLGLPQIEAIFFNQEKLEILQDKNVRQALALAIDKDRIVADDFDGNARTIDGPILPNSFAYNENINKYEFNLDEAGKLLLDAGWEKTTVTEEEIQIIQEELTATSTDETEDEIKEKEIRLALGTGEWLFKEAEDSDEEDQYLKITLTTIDSEDSLAVANSIKEDWEKIGVKAVINAVSVNDIQSSVIDPREFEAVLYGQIGDNDPDCYVFWHSSQAGTGGLNIAGYENEEVDTLLEEARLSSNREERIEKYQNFQEIITDEVPTIFIYSPYYTYAQNKKVKGFEVNNISSSADRFANISDWYIETAKKIKW